jgi:hypothetical protein
MTAVLIDHARVSTDQQDLTAQRDGLTLFGVSANRIHVDHVARTRKLPLNPPRAAPRRVRSASPRIRSLIAGKGSSTGTPPLLATGVEMQKGLMSLPSATSTDEGFPSLLHKVAPAELQEFSIRRAELAVPPQGRPMEHGPPGP